MSELPKSCPICGKPMEKGIVRAEGNAIGVVVRWRNETNPLSEGETLKWGFIKTVFNGVRCKSCKIIILNYGE